MNNPVYSLVSTFTFLPCVNETILLQHVSFGKPKAPFKEEPIYLAEKKHPDKSLFVPPPTVIPIVGTMEPMHHVITHKPKVVQFDLSGRENLH